MKILIQAAEIIDSASSFHKKVKNVLVNNGRIAEIGDKVFAADRIIGAEGMKLTIGWFDLGTFVGDPGLEQKEDIESLSRAAAAGSCSLSSSSFVISAAAGDETGTTCSTMVAYRAQASSEARGVRPPTTLGVLCSPNRWLPGSIRSGE